MTSSSKEYRTLNAQNDNLHPVLFTIDLDRDWPVESLGRMEGQSGIRKDTPDNPMIDGTKKGTELILDLLEELDVRASFFIEATVLHNLPAELQKRLKKHEIGCHGYAHEDFLGLGSKYFPSNQEIEDAICNAINLIREKLTTPTGFRAPYLRSNPNLKSIVEKCGFTYDSSDTHKQAKELQHYVVGDNLVEVPFSTGQDVNGNVISGYLWQLHEGKRNASEYLRFIRVQELNKEIQYTMIATHPWHLFLSTNRKEYLTGKALERNHSEFRKFLTSIQNRIQSVEEYLNLNL